MYVATLIGAAIDDALLGEWVQQFDSDWTAGTLASMGWVEPGHAADLCFAPSPEFAPEHAPELASGLADLAHRIALATKAGAQDFDVVIQPLANRRKSLLIADMDSTMITVECIDELADYAGIKPQIAAITEAAMRGELDFAAALDARVALLAGMDEGVIERCLAERVRIMPGATELVRTMRAHGATAILVSGGFTRFADPVARAIGFDRAIANVLDVQDGRLTGTVATPIVDADTKLATLLGENRPRAEILAVGDGANDLPMIRAAGLGVAYHAKPVVAAAAGARVDHNDLTALLYAQGYPRSAWVTA